MEASPHSRPAPARRGIRVTERDRELLAFLAEHKLALAAHVQALLGTSERAAQTRLRALAGEGLVNERHVFHRQPACYLITRKGLGAIGSELPAPRLDLRFYEHDIGLAWLWLYARAGTFGSLREIHSERQMRSLDASPEGPAEPLAVRLGGVGAGGRERLHYPDLLLTSTGGHRIALELELSAKGRTRRETILSGYAADARVDAVVYLVPRPEVARSVRASAAKLGVSALVHVQPVRMSVPRAEAGSVAVASRVRAAEHGAQAAR